MRHTNLISIIGGGKYKFTNKHSITTSGWFIVMPLMTRDLQQLIFEHTNEQYEPLIIARNIAAGLAHLHSYGIVHRFVFAF